MATKLENLTAQIAEMEKKLSVLATESAEHRARAEKAEKDLADGKVTSTHYLKQMGAAQDEVKQVHILLDAMPNPPARKVNVEEPYKHDVTFELTTRFAAWLASRNNV